MIEIENDSDDILAIVAVRLLLQKEKVKKRRRWWVHQWFARREQIGAYKCQLKELRNENVEEYLFEIFIDMGYDSIIYQ